MMMILKYKTLGKDEKMVSETSKISSPNRRHHQCRQVSSPFLFSVFILKHYLVDILSVVIVFFLLIPSASAHNVNLSVVSKIESSNNPLAHNKKSDARGLFQITPVCLKHFNQVHKLNYSKEALYIPSFNFKVANWYFSWLSKKTNSVRETLIAYNCGLGCLSRNTLPKETVGYLEKYQSLNGAL